MAKTQQRILTGEEQQHQGCMTIKIITANKAFLPAGVVQGTEGPGPGMCRPAHAPAEPGELALLQPQMPSEPSKQRFTNTRVDSAGISQGVKMGFPCFSQGRRISSCSDFAVLFVLGEMCSHTSAHTLTHTHTSRALFGCSWMQVFSFFPLL